MLSSSLPLLVDKKNLLAFSAGVDSSALFFLLLMHDIEFDIALVNYGTRPNSDIEEAHAKELAKKYNLIAHTAKAPKFTNHFEQNAREFRYAFFEELIEQYKYDNLLTAHQLNDQLEWLLMRLSKGAGLPELLGLSKVNERDHYTIIRPLLEYSKEELLSYLEKYEYPYFIDESNNSDKYERNRFRKKYADSLISEHRDGIRRSIQYLKRDKQQLDDDFKLIYSHKNLRIIELKSIESKARAVDITLKKLGYLISAKQRAEIEDTSSLVIGGNWAIEETGNTIYITPFVDTPMPKTFKEQCRIYKIPSKIRPYLYKEDIEPASLRK